MPPDFKKSVTAGEMHARLTSLIKDDRAIVNYEFKVFTHKSFALVAQDDPLQIVMETAPMDEILIVDHNRREVLVLVEGLDDEEDDDEFYEEEDDF